MLQTIKKFFGIGTQVDYGELVKQGVVILDVRTKEEFENGHIEKAINIPLDQLGNNLSKLKDKDKPIICCCASGMRSGSAANMLKSKGYSQVYNGGGWIGLNRKIHS